MRIGVRLRGMICLLGLALGVSVTACRGSLGPEGEGGPSAHALDCPDGTLACGGVCVDPNSSDANCGSCGSACAPGTSCGGGACVPFCSTGSIDCGTGCREVASDVQNCGACGVSCGQLPYCDGGVCSDTCTDQLCQTASGNVCADLKSHDGHCGTCNNACAAGQACVNGVCETSCPSGKSLCGGTCVDVTSDGANCGTCGNVCPAGKTCSAGSCSGEPICTGGGQCTCTGTDLYCNGSCVPGQTDVQHCGACGVACLPTQMCVAGSCDCPGTTQVCAETCVDTQTDEAHCGTCGTVCGGGTTCQAGQCLCEAGLDVCDGTCVDLDSDVAHCGTCGTACESYEECILGICKYDGDQCGGDARNIDIVRLALYQGVEVDLFEGEIITPEGRSVDVIQGRDALIRVFVTPGGGFSARELSARIFVENAGEISVYHHKRTVSAASTQNNLASTFLLNVPAAVISSATNYWVELVECGTPPTGTVGAVRIPEAQGGTTPFGARATGTIKVVFVPVTHDGRTPDVSSATIAAYAAEVASQYPTVGVEASARAPMQSGQSGVNIDLGYTLDQVTEQRGNDGVADDVYYYGLIDPASSFNSYCSGGCTTGVGWVPDATGWGSTELRAAVGVGFGTSGVGTFAHELGHNHGRNHAPCGGPSGVDPGYPYSGASIGSWGYDRDAMQLRDPSQHTDFMGYCNSTWVSDYTFQGLAERIAIVNGAESAQANVLSGPVATWYRFVATSSGMRWSTPMSGAGAPGPSPEAGAAVDASGQVVASVDVYRVEMSHDGGYMLFVPPPQSGWHAVGLQGGPYLAY